MKVKGGDKLGCSGGHGILEPFWVVRMAGASIQPGNEVKKSSGEVSLPVRNGGGSPGHVACPLRLVGEGRTSIPDLPERDLARPPPYTQETPGGTHDVPVLSRSVFSGLGTDHKYSWLETSEARLLRKKPPRAPGFPPPAFKYQVRAQEELHLLKPSFLHLFNKRHLHALWPLNFRRC